MSPGIDSTHPVFWDVRYEEGRIPWDAGGVPEQVQSFVDRFPRKGSVLMPGCGSAYEVRTFVKAGWEVKAIDFSKEAVERAQKILGPLADRVTQADFFLPESIVGQFDLVYERRFLCSLPPTRWPDYAARMDELVRPGGRLAGFFFYGCEDEPPPFPLTMLQALTLLGSRFELVEDQPAPEDERWQVWKKK